MVQAVLQVTGLPEAPLDASAQFHAQQVPIARELLGGDIDALAIVFPRGGKLHQGWQLAMIQSLAREAAPKRVNGVVGGGSDSTAEATDWLASSDGITGQLLSLQSG